MGKYEDWLKPWRPTGSPDRSQFRETPGEPAIPPDSLDQFTKAQRAFLERRVRLQAPDLRKITAAQLPTYFERAGGISSSAFILTFVFQYFVRFKAQLEEPIRGNIRSFWYRKMARQLERLGLLDSPGGLSVTRVGPRGRYLLKTMENAFETLFRQDFFRYKDLEVFNHREKFRRMGRENKRHLFYVEKEGMDWLCEEAHEKHSVHTYASRGSASWLDVDYLGEAIAKLSVRNLNVGAMTDFDPWGVFISQQIQSKLQHRIFGFRKINLATLTTLDLFEPDVIELNKRDLLKGHEGADDPIRKIVEEWVRQGGGINGEPYGIHVDHATPARMHKRIEQWLKGKWEPQPIRLELPPRMRRRLERQMGVELP